MKKIIVLASFMLIIIMIACKKDLIENSSPENYSSTPVLPTTPYDYTHSQNDNLATLGRVLFYDKKLSQNNSVACASCHQQEKAFCDNLQFSTGLEDLKTKRNSPSIFAKQGRMFWDGRASSLSALMLKPIKNHIEMKFDNLGKLAEKISKIDYYPELFNKAFFSTDIDSNRIQMALAEFVSNFTFSNNKFKQSQMTPNALNGIEKAGETVFFGKGKCAQCHHIDGGGSMNGYGFTDMEFNIGLDDSYSDNGVGVITGNTNDNGKFMVPSLLNVELTAPYMHDGRFKTLEEVVEHYDSGIKNHPNLSSTLRSFSGTDSVAISNMTQQQILLQFDTNHDGIISDNELTAFPAQKLNLTTSEKSSLVSFLRTLTDGSILIDKRFSNPFKH